MKSVRIVCVNKDNGNHANRHEAISHYGWIDENSTPKGQGKDTRQVMVQFVEKGGRAYVEDSSGNTANCAVRTSANGTKFLQTHSDGKYTDNLINLPECR